MRIEVPCPTLAAANPIALGGLPADLAFCHPDLLGVLAIDDRAIVLEVAADSEDLRTQVSRVVELSISSYRFVRDVPPLWRNPALDRYADGGAFTRFLADHTVELGPGQYALVGPAAELRTLLDARCRSIAAEIGAETWHLPSVVRTHDVVRTTGYLASHGQHVTFGYHLPAHFDQIRRFADDARAHELAWPEAVHHLEPTGFMLSPVACHNMYRALRGTQLRAGRAITALGTCYRNEGFRFAPLLRQWEFSVREIALAGPPSYVADQRQRLVELAQDLARELDLDARLEIATDPFFVSDAASARTYQALHSTKLELRLAIDGTTAIAAASFNAHGHHFSEPMAIHDGDGNPVETGCVGFGLERWMAAVIARWGGLPQD